MYWIIILISFDSIVFLCAFLFLLLPLHLVCKWMLVFQTQLYTKSLSISNLLYYTSKFPNFKIENVKKGSRPFIETTQTVFNLLMGFSRKKSPCWVDQFYSSCLNFSWLPVDFNMTHGNLHWYPQQGVSFWKSPNIS